MFVKNAWYVAARPKEIGRTPLRRLVCNEPIVFYRTQKGAWILNQFSDRQGSGESYTVISEVDAVHWLIRNQHEIPSYLSPLAEESEL